MKKNISFAYGYDSDYKTRVALIKDAGFDGVMGMYKNGDDFFEAMDYCRKSGLTIDSIHMPFRDIVNDVWVEGKAGDRFVELMKEGADYASVIGVDKLTVHISSSVCPPPISELGLNRFREIATYYKQKGCVACFENLRRMDYFEAVMGAVGSDAMMCYDIGHRNIYYKDYDMTLWSNKVVTMHIHDNFGTKDEHFLPFEGNVDWDRVAKEIATMRLADALTLETHGSGDSGKYASEKAFLQAGFSALCSIEEMIKRATNE